jgi:UDP-N-acetylglucosamine 3-dehydrogenase
MNVAILGTGFGAYHAELFKKVDRVDKVFMFGRNTEKLKSLRDRLGVTFSTDPQELMDNPEIDLVDVCLPGPLHREYMLRALQAGKHVYCETPLCLDEADIQPMLKGAEVSQKKVFVDLFLRFEFPYTFLHGILARQTLGHLQYLRIERKTPPLWGDLGPENIVPQLMIHDIDFATWMCGKPEQISALLVDGLPGQCAVTGYWTGLNTRVELFGSSMMPMGYPFAVRYEAIFEKGVVRYAEDGYQDREEKRLEVFSEGRMESVEIPTANCYETAIRHVVDCIVDNAVPVNCLQDAVVSIEAAFRMREQIHPGR